VTVNQEDWVKHDKSWFEPCSRHPDFGVSKSRLWQWKIIPPPAPLLTPAPSKNKIILASDLTPKTTPAVSVVGV